VGIPTPIPNTTHGPEKLVDYQIIYTTILQWNHRQIYISMSKKHTLDVFKTKALQNLDHTIGKYTPA